MLVGLYVLWGIWTALSVRTDAEAARRELRQAREDLDVASLLDGDGLAVLDGSADRFASIAGRLDNPLLAPVRALPVLGRQLQAAEGQASAAAEGLRAASRVGEEVVALADEGLSSGPARVATLRQVAAAAGDGRRTFEDLDLGPGDALIGPLRDARDELDEALADALDLLGRAEAAGTGLAQLFEGPYDFLLLAANNAQMQNGQGMFLSAGVLHIEDGRMELGPMESLEDVPDVVPPVELDPHLRDRWGWLDPNTDLRHLGLSHRFPTTAELAAELWVGIGREPVDGVLALDPYVVEAIMTATGPLPTSAGELGPDDVVPYILHQQYQGYLVDGDDRSYTDERRDILDEIAGEVLGAFEQVSTVESDFLEQLRETASGRHLLMWSADPTLQAAFEAAGVHGEMDPDGLMLSLVNRSGVKLDWFMEMSADLSTRRLAEHHEVTIEVTVANGAPASGEPRYVVGPYPGSGLDEGDYLGLVTLNLPQDAIDAGFEGVDPLAVAGPDGPNRTIAAWVRVPRGQSTTLEATFRLPIDLTELRVDPSGRARPTAWSYGERTWRHRTGRTVELDPDR